MGWSIEISGMPGIIHSIAEIIDDVAFETGTAFWEEYQVVEIKNTLKELK
jgi:hypothetical protein